MNRPRTEAEALARIQWLSLAGGGVALLAAGGGAIGSPGQFFRSYLTAFLFWLGPTLGSLALLLLHHLTGGAWGDTIQRFLRAGSRLVPLAALMFLPLLPGLSDLYIWASPDQVAGNHLLEHKSAYLNVPFFVARAGVYFALWTALAFTATSRGARTPDVGSPRRFSAPWLILLGVTMAFAAVDWVMSVDPLWFSSIYPVTFIMGQMLQALALAIIAAAWIRRWPDHRERLTRAGFNDLGNLCLAFVMLWAYLAFSEFLIIWSGDLPADSTWYVRRTSAGWQTVAIGLVLLHFAFPFFLLLSRRAKRSASALAAVALTILFARFVGTYWLVQPGFHPSLIQPGWLDIVLPLGLGGIWVSAFAASLRRQTALAAPAAAPEKGA